MNRTLLAALVAVSAPAATASAREIALGVEGGWATLSATRSAKAVFDGETGGPTFGASLRVGVNRSLYVGLTGRFFSKDGERAFVASTGGEAFPLGHPLTMRVVPVHAVAGWRFRPDQPFVPYVSLGVGATSYHEESTVGGLPEDAINETKASGLGAAGVEYGRGRLRFGLDLSYLVAPDSLGLGGVSKAYGEDDVGGFAAQGRIAIVF